VKNGSREHFLILKNLFASFRVFREIRVRTRSLPFFSFSFFSVYFCGSSALSAARSDLTGTQLPDEP